MDYRRLVDGIFTATELPAGSPHCAKISRWEQIIAKFDVRKLVVIRATARSDLLSGRSLPRCGRSVNLLALVLVIVLWCRAATSTDRTIIVW